jgi:hypothetical protein
MKYLNERNHFRVDAMRALTLWTIGLCATVSLYAQSLSTDFSGTTLPSSLAVGYGSDYVVSAGQLNLTGSSDSERTYVVTSTTGYYDDDFTADIVFTLTGNILFFGLGEASSFNGTTDIGLSGSSGPVIGARLHSQAVGEGMLGLIDHKNNTGSSSTPRWGYADFSGINMLRFHWDGLTHTGYFELDALYNGTFLADFISPTLDGSDNEFTADNTFLYIGGAGSSIDSFVVTAAAVVPEPAAFTGITATAILGVVISRRRFAPRTKVGRSS